MAIQTILGGLEYPVIPTSSGAGPGRSTLTGCLIDAASEKFAMIVQAPKAGDIRKVLWSTGTVTTGATLDVRLETIDASTGMPSGTLFGTNTNGSQVVADTDDDVGFATQLTADATVTQGQLLAVVIANPAASFGNLRVGAINVDADHNVPYAALFTSAWSKQSFGLVVGFEYSDGSMAPIPGAFATGIGAITAENINSTTTPDTAGSRFRVPFACRVRGCWVLGIAAGDCTIRLVTTAYHQANATGILATYTHDKDLQRSTTTVNVYRLLFDQPATLSINTDYRLIVEPSTSTNDSLYTVTVSSLAQLDGMVGGRDWHYTTAKDPTGDGDWTNFNSGIFKRPLMGLLIDGFDDGAGGGGGGEVSHVFIG